MIAAAPRKNANPRTTCARACTGTSSAIRLTPIDQDLYRIAPVRRRLPAGKRLARHGLADFPAGSPAPCGRWIRSEPRGTPLLAAQPRAWGDDLARPGICARDVIPVSMSLVGLRSGSRTAGRGLPRREPAVRLGSLVPVVQVPQHPNLVESPAGHRFPPQSLGSRPRTSAAAYPASISSGADVKSSMPPSPWRSPRPGRRCAAVSSVHTR